MPTYDFRNKLTEEFESHFMGISEKEQFLADNPHLESVIYKTPPTIVSVHGRHTKIDDGFKDHLNRIKNNNPGSTISID